MGKAKRREETNEASWPVGDSTGGLSGRPEDVESSKEKKFSTLREYAETLVTAIILALVIRTFVIQAFKIPSGSMLQTLQIGDHILVNKFIYGVRLPFTDITLIPVQTPKRRDIIVFRFPEDESKDFIKRVIGIPGDIVEIKEKVLYVNGQPQRDETYINKQDAEEIPHIVSTRDNFGPITVPKDSYFVMGDNRDHSLDSRFWGFVHNSKIKGEAIIIYWSWDSEATWVRFNRIGKILR
ncbi:MAG: signal peptidase I [Nitrospirae bacterium]|nr:signal peptidase I [Candidatus Troglogloeales bacterium]